MTPSSVCSQFDYRETWKHLKMTKATSTRNHGLWLTAKWSRNIADVWRIARRNLAKTTWRELFDLLNLSALIRSTLIHYFSSSIRQCSERTWDRFTCNFKEMASEILSVCTLYWYQLKNVSPNYLIDFQKCSEGQAEKYFGDIGKINANCIKIDCQPQCIGNAGCDPLLRDADIGCIKEAMKQAKSELPDHDCIDDLENLERILIQHANGIAACRKNHKSPMWVP